VFVFQERSLSLKLPASLGENSLSPKQLPFNLETWTQGGLRYFVIGDASAADIDSLAKLLKSRHRFDVRKSDAPYRMRHNALRHKLIAHGVYGEKVCRVRRVALQFLPQPKDVVVHSSRAGVVLVPPNFIEQFIPRDRAFSMNHQ
jgi:hypothetical protein